ncbi:MAG: tRNA guanosine(34) transglycosylase Tgt [Actinobacteria bacterium]|nr:tRNA guanosine(34) transglycosylase Tgt [Actinomycetota bacterium]
MNKAPNFKFKIIKTSSKSKARAGELYTPHGIIKTPVFMPVGTQASVKALTPEQLHDLNTQIILANTYHLSIRPGAKLIQDFKGLHQFMNWQKPILTDSGGYQVFSLAQNCKISNNGVTFQSHLDGRPLNFTPEHVIDLQYAYNSDIMMPLDICSPSTHSKDQIAKDLIKTHRWAKKAHSHWESLETKQWLFGIIQGGQYHQLRQESIDYLSHLNFPGYAIGGVSVGEDPKVLKETLEYCLPKLPSSKPRYVMGVGLPENLLHAIHEGADMFDCVIPTRLARHGQVFFPNGRQNIKRQDCQSNPNPIDEHCPCYTCQHFSIAYLHHLFKSGELLSHTLLSIHNIAYLINTVTQIREQILNEPN